MRRTMLILVAAILAPQCFAKIHDVDAGGRVPSEAGQTISTTAALFYFTFGDEKDTLTQVDLNLDMVHSWDEDLTIKLAKLKADNVTVDKEILIFDKLPGGPPDFADFGSGVNTTYFMDAAATKIQDGTAPYAGSFKPMQALSAFNGMNPNGKWRLSVFDNNYGDYGWLYKFGDPKFETRRKLITGTQLIITTPVPEPGSLAALLACASVFALRRRR